MTVKEEVIVNKKDIIVKLPEDFFTRDIPEKKQPDPPEDMIPFKWSEEVLSGKYEGKVILTSPDEEDYIDLM